MKNIEKRLTAAEKKAAKTELVIVEFKDPELDSRQVPLMDAIGLFIDGKLLTIRYIMKPGEQRKYQSDTIREIEEYMASLTTKELKMIIADNP